MRGCFSCGLFVDKETWKDAMKKKQRIFLKLVITIVCTLCLIWLIRKDTTVFQIELEQPEGEGVNISDVIILMEALDEGTEIHSQDEKSKLLTELERREDNTLLYGDYIRLLNIYLGETDVSDNSEFLRLKKNLSYDKKYREEFYLLSKDWYDAYDQLVAAYGMTGMIYEQELFLLAGNKGVKNPVLGDNQVLTSEGNVYEYHSEEFEQCFFSRVKAYVKTSGVFLTVTQKMDDSVTLPNLWIMEADEAGLQFFYEGYEILCPWGEEMQVEAREQIADVTFGEGKLQGVRLKTERVNGKLLRLTGEEVEIEECGTYPVAENCKGYQLYETLEERELSSLGIGYDFTDFVVEDGKICAFLVMRRENMESIRVAVKSDGFRSLYHEELTFRADCDLEVIYGNYGNRKSEIISAGTEILIDNNSDYLDGDRIEIRPLVQSGKIQVLSIVRSQGPPSYRGKMEVVKESEGLLLINELLLEEYLYSVVPSEMPAGYPMEALKAQAICARTYAYRYLLSPGLGSLGAHVDDSVSYQVYNNVAEHTNATEAVKETTGELLCHEGEPVSTYYYSTSWGFGTDAGIWKEENAETMPYISSHHISAKGQDSLAEEMAQEEIFREYLSSPEEEDFEREEPWYRWEYHTKEISVQRMSQRLKERYSADNNKVLTFVGKKGEQGDETKYESREPKEIKEIYDISVLSRRPGGVIRELLIATDAGTYKILSEYNVRYLLSQGGSVLRQDGSQAEASQLLPSAYLMIELEKSGENVVGYKISGGGYGHGAGLSQNGARAMGNAGMDCEGILTFFYEGCEVERRY